MKRFTSETLVGAVVVGFVCSLAHGQQIPIDNSCDSCTPEQPLCAVRETVDGLFERPDGTVVIVLCTPNLRPAAVLSRLDIDGDGVADNAPDSDGDGLPDNWEAGGVEARSADGSEVDRVVFYPAPTAIVPGTPPTPIFTRLAVTTSALDPDTDDDGLSDFVEVFGLKFIDENGDGILQSSGRVDRGREWVEDGNCGRLPAGGDTPQSELDLESGIPGDGLPSPGECPRDNSGFANGRGRVNADDTSDQDFLLRHDFDGFVFTDPLNPDTDGDSIDDGKDNDPLINPRAFGEIGIIVKFNAEGIDDFDQDGLGNGMDMGNDLVVGDFADGATGARDFQEIDNPLNVIDLLELFRRDLVFEENEAGDEVPIANPTVPEAQIEDLLGVDWDGNGLWRTTDVRTWNIIIDDDSAYVDMVVSTSNSTVPPKELFVIGNNRLYTPQRFCQLAELFGGSPCPSDPLSTVPYQTFGSRGIGLGWQELLQPTGTPTNFLPDDRVWTILYSWRMPGFDIDGDGFVGVPNLSNTKSIERIDTGAVDVNFSVFSVAFVPGNGPDGLALSNEARSDDTDDPNALDTVEQVDDYIAIPAQRRSAGEGDLDGRITVDGLCGTTAGMWTSLIFMGLCTYRLRRRVQRA